MKSKPFVDLDNARKEDQRQVMEQIIAEGHCPFCPENFSQYHFQPKDFDGEFWFVTKNQWPYDHTKHHYLAILKRHAEKISELTAAEGAELIELMGKLEKKLSAPGGAFAMRFGDSSYSAGSVSHIHAQFIVPDIEADDYQPTRLKIGKTRK